MYKVLFFEKYKLCHGLLQNSSCEGVPWQGLGVLKFSRISGFPLEVLDKCSVKGFETLILKK